MSVEPSMERKLRMWRCFILLKVHFFIILPPSNNVEHEVVQHKYRSLFIVLRSYFKITLKMDGWMMDK
jgi:hypothetical protein